MESGKVKGKQLAGSVAKNNYLKEKISQQKEHNKELLHKLE